MSYDDNPVLSPEKYGFELVGEIDLSEPCYSFDLLAVLKNDQGYYLGTDSGCSCPSPWESHTVESFTGPMTAEQAREEAHSLATLYDSEPYAGEQFIDLVDKIV